MKKPTFLLLLFVLTVFLSGCLKDAGPGCPDASCCKAEWDDFKYEFRIRLTDEPVSVAEGGGFEFKEKINERTYWIGICSRDFELIVDTLIATHPRYQHPPDSYPYFVTGDIYERITPPTFSGLPLYHIWVQRVKTEDGQVIFER